jgi:hypothetical protein
VALTVVDVAYWHDITIVLNNVSGVKRT